MRARHPEAARLIAQLGLQPHPEGGHYRETWRAAQALALPGRYGGARASGTAIYYLLEAGDRSALHRIASDEVWHFYAGQPLRVVMLHPSGEREDLLLGSAWERGESFQGVVPAGSWFGASLDVDEGFALVGCTVAPGFDFMDLEFADVARLARELPQHEGIIRALGRARGGVR